MRIDSSPASYEPNSIADNWPRETPPGPSGGGFESYQERIDGHKIRERSPSFGEYYSHPRLFWLSQTEAEQQHIIDAYSFELSRVMRPYIRERVVDLLTRVDPQLAAGVAANLGICLTEEQCQRPLPSPVNGVTCDAALSLYADHGGSVKGRIVAILIAPGVVASDVLAILEGLKEQGVHSLFIGPHMGRVSADDGSLLPIDGTFDSQPSVTVDAVIVADGAAAALMNLGAARYYLLEAYKHLKVIALSGRMCPLREVLLSDGESEDGVVEGEVAKHWLDHFLAHLARHRVWSRAAKAARVAA